ncbi:hypothetical protein [Streptomyces paromomycinus]|uniref:hypothetical protein n=1 Tax=Streptomyces paromomycinus TaxID=92743 RepID=UPI0033E2D0DE
MRTLREDGFAGLVLADPALYTEQAATEDEPFPTDGQLSFGDPLENAVADQLGRGASTALTPTGYLRQGDLDALMAAARQVQALDHPRVIFAVPVDVAWLRGDAVKRLISVLHAVSGAKALMLGGQIDPLARFPEAVGNLVRIVRQVPGVALLRTDLAAFGALAHGAAFTAFGTTSGLRHIVPPPQPAKTSRNGGPNSPHVLVPDLMAFFLGRKIADRYASTQPPLCSCAACQGRGLDTFATMSEQKAAAAHNAAALTGWARQLDAVVASQRAGWWQRRCQRAIDHYDVVNAAIEQPGAFTPPPQLLRWAQLPVPAPEQTRTPPTTGGDGGRAERA